MNTSTRKSNRSVQITRRKDNQSGRHALKLLNQSVSHVRGPIDPLPINKDVVITKRVERGIAANGTLDVTGVLLSSMLQNTDTYFDIVRIQKVSAYGAAVDGGSVVVDFPVGDLGHFLDRGTSGQKRPQLHLQPTFDQRSTWIPISNTTIQFSVTNGAGSGLVQITIEARSLAGTDT